MIAVRFPVLFVEGMPTTDRRVLLAGQVSAGPFPVPIMRMLPCGPTQVGELTYAVRVPGAEMIRRDGAAFPDGSWVWSGRGRIGAPRNLVVEWIKREFPAADMIGGDMLLSDCAEFTLTGMQLCGVTLTDVPAWPDVCWELDNEAQPPS